MKEATAAIYFDLRVKVAAVASFISHLSSLIFSIAWLPEVHRARSLPSSV